MISNVITYLILGVAFNFVFDILVSKSEAEEFRFTMSERIIMTILWPLGVGAFIFNFVRNLNK